MNRRDFLSYASMAAAGTFIPWRGAQAEGRTLRGYLRSNWSRDPYTFGSYSYVARDAQQPDRLTLGKPVGNRVYFAGEAVHPTHNSTVHAAYESGVMVAEDVGRNTSGNVAIIGAGVSGLAAAQALSEGGRTVTVIEAQDRIGGRVRTSNVLGSPLDLGASWIHGTRRNPIHALARDINAQTVATDETYIARGAAGQVLDDNTAPGWLENVTTIQHNAGADSSEINLNAYNAQTEYSGKDVIFPEGYESILPALQGNYDIQTSKPVSAISYGEEGVSITANGIATQFDVVVVTLPLGVLKRDIVTFSPPLPADKQAAISKLGMGTLDKLYLRYDQPFWDEDTTWIATPENGLPQGQFNQWLNLYKYIGEPIIMGFNGGPPALQLAQLSDDEIVLQGQQALESAYF
ncbi:FAD-dependent oxidoreductase [Halocynthiibacter sp.]|uniref:flavin monoamine oxidase family protein n=1 Tax=Halocynthiibacter sp. TaxID=1979210 RepID=UPI003C36D40E